MDDRTKYWIAGWLEGEGSFMAKTPAGGGPTVSGVSTDYDTICRVGEIFGVKVQGPHRGPGNRKPYWRVFLTGWRAVELMRRLYPLMSERRQLQMVRAIYSIGDLRKGDKTRGSVLTPHYAAIIEMARSGATFEEIARSLPVRVSDEAVRRWCQLRGISTGRRKLTPEDAEAIRASSETTSVLAERYGVGRRMIFRVKCGERWPAKKSA